VLIVRSYYVASSVFVRATFRVVGRVGRVFVRTTFRVIRGASMEANVAGSMVRVIRGASMEANVAGSMGANVAGFKRPIRGEKKWFVNCKGKGFVNCKGVYSGHQCTKD